MVTAPDVVDDGFVVQSFIPAEPEIVQSTFPVGAAAPVVPVTVVVNVKVELSDPPPVPVSTTVGMAFATTTLTGVVAESDV